MNSFTLYIETRVNCYNLIQLEEEIIIQYILDIDSKGFPFKFKMIEDIANYIFELKDVKYIEKF